MKFCFFPTHNIFNDKAPCTVDKMLMNMLLENVILLHTLSLPSSNWSSRWINTLFLRIVRTYVFLCPGCDSLNIMSKKTERDCVLNNLSLQEMSKKYEDLLLRFGHNIQQRKMLQGYICLAKLPHTLFKY